MIRRKSELALAAKTLQGDVRRIGLADPKPSPVALFETLVSERGLRESTKELFYDGHYARAVEEGIKYLCERVRRRTGLSADGTALMQLAFSPNAPALQVNSLANASDRDEQQGFMFIFQGCVSAIRNPRSHRYRHKDSAKKALELLALENHLARIIRSSRVVHKGI